MLKDNTISKEFVDRFTQNYINRDQWVTSDVLYEQFGKNNNNTYGKFTKQIERELTIDSEYKVVRK